MIESLCWASVFVGAAAFMFALGWVAGHRQAQDEWARPEMSVQCAWCRRHLSGPPISHGICPECAQKELEKMKGNS